MHARQARQESSSADDIAEARKRVVEGSTDEVNQRSKVNALRLAPLSEVSELT